MAQKLEQTLYAIFLATLVWAPLPFGSNRIWAGALLATLVLTTLAAWLALFAAGKAKLNAGLWQHARLPLALLLLVQAWVWLQIQYLPREVVDFLSPQAYEWHLKEGWLPISLDREQTRYYLLLGCTYTAAFFLTLALVNTHSRLKLFLQVLVFSGTFQAAYGAFMVLSGLEYSFFIEKYVGKGVATGTFINRNHLAGYLNMTLAAGVGLLLSQLATDSAHSWKERARRWLRLLLSPKIRLRIYLAVMVVALVLTRSRMGNVAFFTGLALAGAIALYTGRRFSPRVVAFLASLFLVDMLILGKWFGFDELLERLARSNPEAEGRTWSNAYAIDYFKDFPITGSGGGSFYGVFPNYQGEEFAGFHLHAHNDYLQFALELGVVAAASLGALLLLALHSAYRVQETRRTPLYKGAAFGVTMAIIWVLLHSLVDFNLQIPANAFTLCSVLGLAFALRVLPGKENPR